MSTVASFYRHSPGRFVTTIIIGAGQAGLSMSRCLTKAGVDHVLLERGEVANSWRKERWDSLRLLSPNWQTRLVDYQYQGDNPDEFMSCNEFISYLTRYSETVEAPIHTGVKVEQVTRTQNGYRVLTNTGEWQCKALVLATGECSIPKVPRMSEALPSSINQVTPKYYRNPGRLANGGVLIVGASATGLQLAEEIQQSGRQVTVCAGEQTRMPRRYRGKDINWWMDQCGVLDVKYTEVDDLNRVRRIPSLQLVGSSPPRDLDINNLTRQGINFVGRLAGIKDHKALFSGSLANVCKMADLKMERMLRTIDSWIEENGLEHLVPPSHEMEPTRVETDPRLEMSLHSGEIRTVIWATGYRPDFSWLNVPVFDRKGDLKHDGGVVDAPGLYAMGLTFMRRRKSIFIDGVAEDANDLSHHIVGYLRHADRSSTASVA